MINHEKIYRFSGEVTKPIYLFLDIDGVLNFQAMYEEDWFKDQVKNIRGHLGEADECLMNLHSILLIFSTARIVISSSQRYSTTINQFVERFNEVLPSHHWKERIIATTGEYGDARGYQIRDWLEKNAGMFGYSTRNLSKEAYVVCIDDHPEDILPALNWQYIVQTRYMWPFRGFDLSAKDALIGCLMYQHRQMMKNPTGVIEL